MSAERIDTAAVLAGVDLPELVGRYIPLTKASNEYLGLCPFHADTNPSMRVIPTKGFIYCHACSWHGNAIDFVMEYTGAPFIEAARSLNGTLAPSMTPIQRPALSADTSVDWQPVIPVPASAPVMDPTQLWNPKRDRASSLAPTATYMYRDPAGAIVGHVLRVETANGKITPTVTYCTNVDTGEQRWCLAPMPKPRPLYNLDRLTANPAAKVLLVEGERCADAAAPLWGAMVVTTWPGGTAGAKHTDWTPLAGRDVVMWPDNDEPGIAVMHEIASILALSGCTLRILPPPGIDKPKGWDVADAISDGHMTEAQLKKWVKDNLVSYVAPVIAAPAPEQKKPPVVVPSEAAEPLNDGELAAEGYLLAQGDQGEGDSSTATADHDAAQESTAAPAKPKRTLRGPGGVELGVVDGNAIRKPKQKQPELSPLTAAYTTAKECGLLEASNGKPHCNEFNVAQVLTHHEQYKGKIWYDEFHQNVFTTIGLPVGDPAVEWTDSMTLRTLLWMQGVMDLSKVSEKQVYRAVRAVAFGNRKNCVKDWLESLEWDGVHRLENLMADGWGAKQNDYSKAVGRCWITSMVARIMWPGCQADYMTVFESEEGLKKTSALNLLTPHFAECHENMNGKAFQEHCQGVWLLEITEMHAFNKSEIEKIKGIVSCRDDRYRAPWGMAVARHKRQVILTGTTNRDDWNKSDTGARRFWPIWCTSVNLDYIRENRDQFFAEALHYFNLFPADEIFNAARVANRADWWNVPVEDARKEQEDRRDADSWEDTIAEWLKICGRSKVNVNTVLDLAINVKPADMDRAKQNRVASCLRALGWTKTTERDPKDGGRPKKMWTAPILDTPF